MTHLIISFFNDEVNKTRKRISQEELDYLKRFDFKKSKEPTPWKNFLLSLPVWGNIITWVASNYIFYNLVSVLPLYLNNVHGQNIRKVRNFGFTNDF